MRAFAFAALIAAAAVLAAGSSASAADLELRAIMQAAGPRITLGDLFEGAGAKGAVVVGAAAPAGGQTVLDAGLVQAAAHRAGLAWANAEGRRRLIVASVDKASAPRGAGAKASRAILAYARNINAGEIVQASDLVWSDEAVAPATRWPTPTPPSAWPPAAPCGWAPPPRRTTSPRRASSSATTPVQVAFEEDGISLTLTGRALGDAAVGDAVSVMNPASKKPIDAVACGPGRAVVGAAAEALRARAFPNPSLAYASLRP